MNIPVRIAMAVATAASNHGQSISIDGGLGRVESSIRLAILNREMNWLVDIKVATILIIST